MQERIELQDHMVAYAVDRCPSDLYTEICFHTRITARDYTGLPVTAGLAEHDEDMRLHNSTKVSTT